MKNKYYSIFPVAVSAFVIAGCGHGNKEIKLNEEVVKVQATAVMLKDKAETLSYSGSIAADNQVTLSFLVPGQVSGVYVQEGQHINSGQLLAALEPTEYRNNMLLTEAGLEQSKDNFARLNLLHQSGSLPERDFIAAKVALAQAEINRNLALKRLNDTKIFAPFSGIISSKQIEKGAAAGPGVNAFSIVKTDQVYAQASITEEDIARIGIGDEVTVTIPALKDSLRGKISIINPEADNASRTFIVKVRLGNSTGKILPGMLSTINVSTRHTISQLSVPAQAIIRDADDIPYVYIVDKNNRAIRKRVRTGKLLSNEVMLLGGIQDKDLVVTEGQNKLHDGQQVTLINRL
ncbi:efflux RND transporter periplasmic adaptor subunit [Filimonas effusa]|uniref:Efflux RND transporter periplasmic adaptor subunit n=1 Tax=Filimonas effusa TaxID=2508721 RepID=A0A4Q1D0H3_9BACT|nr:efflux RND transporter periplasmic adaptor subunit [Filimonas effusa]RXK81246.1 efflux RND transporter periplasmic adaptor subunit [Filimonas effusa]